MEIALSVPSFCSPLPCNLTTRSVLCATSSDAEFLYFEWPYLATKEKMFFKVGAGNAFGETK